MQTLDLRRSNAIYIFRSFMHSPKSLKEIAEETKTAEITIKKIVYKLVEENIASKCNLKNNSIGRPVLYLSPNPANHSILIKENDSEFIFYTINTLGQRKKIHTIHKKDAVSEEISLEFAYNILKKDESFKFCNGVYFIADLSKNYKEIDGIFKTELFELISLSLVDDEANIYLEFGDKKAVINHGKIKNTDMNKEDIIKIVDFDQEYIFNDLNEEKATNEALRILTLKKLEEKVAQLFY